MEYLNIIISGIMGLLGVILGFFLKLLSDYLSERKRVKEEFSYIKNSIFSTTITNNLFAELSKLKDFFNRHPEFLERQENEHFFKKWLTKSSIEPPIEEARRAVGYWDKEKVEQMFRDLDKTKL